MSITLCNLFVLNHIFLHTRSVLISINLFSSNRKIWTSSANFKKPTTLSIVHQPLKGVSFVLFVFVLNDLKNVHVSLSLSMLYVTFLLHTVTSLFIKSIYRSVSSWRYGQQSVVFIHWGIYDWYNFFWFIRYWFIYHCCQCCFSFLSLVTCILHSSSFISSLACLLSSSICAIGNGLSSLSFM